MAGRECDARRSASENEVQRCDEFDSNQAVFRYMYQILLEEEEQEVNSVSQEALEATERSFRDALTDQKPVSSPNHPSISAGIDVDPDLSLCSSALEFMKGAEEGRKLLPDICRFFSSSGQPHETRQERNHSAGPEMARKPKQAAVDADAEELVTLEFDGILLYNEDHDETELKRVKERRRMGGDVDLESLLTKCGQAIWHDDQSTAIHLVNEIKIRSSVTGNGEQRMASYFAGALEARLTGQATKIVSPCIPTLSTRPSQMLKISQVFFSVLPFANITNFFTKKNIMKAAEKAWKLHIVDFGIMYGFKWPLFMHQLASRPGGPPKLRITAVDPPLPGFRPNSRMEGTRRFLETYAQRFGLPFHFHAVVKKWETVGLDDFRMEEDEIVVVNSVARFHQLSEEGERSNPRDAILRVVKNMRPAVFILGIPDSAHGSSFFPTRFREALYHYTSVFDMLETVLPCDMTARRLYEQILGSDIMNTLACEGAERIERPERAAIWQQRIARAGFRQIPIHADVIETARAKMKSDYRQGYFVHADRGWLLQGWKGRSINATWKPL